MKVRWLVFLIAMVIAVAAFAHGNKKHLVGTLERVTAESVTLKTAEGRTVEVKLAASTIYVTKDGKPGKLADLVPGQRVAIHATPQGKDLVADEIKFAPAAPAHSPAPGHSP